MKDKYCYLISIWFIRGREWSIILLFTCRLSLFDLSTNIANFFSNKRVQEKRNSIEFWCFYLSLYLRSKFDWSNSCIIVPPMSVLVFCWFIFECRWEIVKALRYLFDWSNPLSWMVSSSILTSLSSSSSPSSPSVIDDDEEWLRKMSWRWLDWELWYVLATARFDAIGDDVRPEAESNGSLKIQ